MPDPDLPPPFDALPDALAGDPDAIAAVFTADVAFTDRTTGEDLADVAAVGDLWAEFAGRRAEASIEEVLADEERAAVAFTVAYQADAQHWVRHGTAWVTLDGDRIAEWDGVWADAPRPTEP
jgi:hypothetical protein